MTDEVQNASPEDEAQERHDEVQDQGQKLADKVEEHLSKGDTSSAKRAFSRSWREAVPDLPLRFSVILVKPNKDLIEKVTKRMRKGGGAPKLSLVNTRDGDWEVRTSSGRRLGNLPSQDAKLLDDLGTDSRLYNPELLEIRSDDEDQFLHIAVELVRPEVRYCSSCGKEHQDDHVNCADCRSKRRRKGDEVTEQTAIGFHEAVDAIAEAPEKEDDLPV